MSVRLPKSKRKGHPWAFRIDVSPDPATPAAAAGAQEYCALCIACSIQLCMLQCALCIACSI